MKRLLTLGSFLIGSFVWAQPNTIYSDSTITTSEFKIGIRYTSDYVYMGRTDSMAAPYFIPSLAYHHKSGFFVRGYLSYLAAKDQNRIDLYGFEGGYEYTGEKLLLGASLSQYIFSDASYVVQAEMNTYANVYAGYDLDAFMVFADVGLGLSDNTDVFTTFDASRTFYTLKNKLLIMPSFTIQAGTQKYYDQYYQYRSPQSGFGRDGGRNGKGPGGSPQPMPVVSILEADKFKVLNYETGIQLTYKLNNFRFFVIGNWAFPVNPATVVVDNQPEKEKLKNTFYFTTGVRLSIPTR